MILIQAIPNAMVTDVAARNVAGQLRKTREAKAEPFGYQGLPRWDDEAYEQRKWWRLGVDLFEYQSIAQDGWVMPDKAGCAI